MTMTADRTSPLIEREVTITRIFNAPRAVVFRAWTDPVQLAQWWGPKGFTNPVCEIDVRIGGALRIHMRGPDGSIYPMKGEFREIVPPERLAFTNIALDEAGNAILEGFTTVTFADDGGKTTLTLRPRGRRQSCRLPARHGNGLDPKHRQIAGAASALRLIGPRNDGKATINCWNGQASFRAASISSILRSAG
jgi:uncharacterized protein YndB with AHSA1/START domain